VKSYNCIRSSEKISIDGNIDKAVWRSATAVELTDTVTGDKPLQETSVRLLWDDEFLYIAFDCVDHEIRAVYTGFNDLLFEEDVVEVFIDDNKDLKTYIEIEVNPHNAVLHYMIANNLEGRILGYARLENCVRSAVSCSVEIKRTQYEIAIPFTEFPTAPHIPPKTGDTWRINFYRIDRGENGQDEYTAWSPTGEAAFHRPQYFGEIKFCE
jgi:hypothetical protein